MSEVIEKPKLVEIFANRYSVDASKVLGALRSTAFRQKGDKEITNEQMMALMIVANEYKLNPFTKEIYAYPDKGSIVPVVSVDGWSRIMNSHPQMDGIEFVYSDEKIDHKGKICHEWIDCIIHRKDRNHPTRVREYFSEVVRNSDYATPWDTHPNRMHRHKAEIQCARIAFGFAGIYDQDEAERIISARTEIDVTSPQIQSASSTQKELFDQLIETDDALGLYVLYQTIPETTRNDLYHSFSKGEKGKYQRIVDGLLAKGHNLVTDYVVQLTEATRNGDTLAIAELVGELNSDALELIKERIGGPEFIQILDDLQ